MSQIKNILAIVGSLRKNSLNRQLAVAAGQILGERAHFSLLEYGDLPFFNEDIEYPAPQSVQRVREAVKNADGLWIFTPEYNHSYPGLLKNLIDWLSRPISKTEGRVVGGKKVTISGLSQGASGSILAQENLVSLLFFLNMKVMNTPRVAIPNARGQCDEQGRLVLTQSRSFLEQQADAFLNYLSAEG